VGRKARGTAGRREGKPAGQVAAPHAAEERAGRGAIVAVAVAGAVLLFVLAAVWAFPRAAEDTYMGLANGRDVFDGKLGKPDDWSFTTAGRVFLNQNWAFDALMVAAFRVGGDGGLLALKALTLLAIAGAAVAAARRRGAGWPPALLVVAAAMAGTRESMELRANLATFLMACLLLAILYDAFRRPRLAWLAVPLIAAWSSLHGGFTLGLALFGLWIAAGAIDAMRAGGIPAAVRWARAPVAAGAAAVASVAISPYGLTNLTHPLTVLGSAEWRAVYEWHPVSFASGTVTAGAPEFAGMIALVVVATTWRVLTRRGVTPAPGPAPAGGTNARFGLVLFDVGLLALMTWMGLFAVRFLPLATVLFAPVAAAQVDALFRGARPWLPTAIGAVALAGAMLPFAVRVAGTYSAASPAFTNESVFERMSRSDELPSGAATFLQDNDVSGNVFADWPWEGFLHWRCPQLRLFIGGRAQGVYDLETLARYRRFGSDPQPAAKLSQWDAHLLVVPMDSKYLRIVDTIAFAPGAHWALAFCDGRTAVLADVSSPGTRPLAERVTAGQARYRSAGVAGLSRSVCAITAGAAVDLQAISGLAAANRALPTGAGPWFMLFAARAHRLDPRAVLLVFEEEYAALGRDTGHAARRLGTLQARASIAQILANLYRSSGQKVKSDEWAAAVRGLTPELEALAGAP